MKYILTSLLLLPYFMLFADQITSIPEVPNGAEEITILFDKSQCDCNLENYSGDIYVHTGIIRKGETEWSAVIGNWGNNSVQPKLEKVNSDLYQLTIVPSAADFYNVPAAEIDQLAFVFRSADGSKQTIDLFINLFEDGVLKITSPMPKNIISLGDEVEIKAFVPDADSYKLYIQGEEVFVTDNEALNHKVSFNSPGRKGIEVEALSGGEIYTSTLWILVAKENTVIDIIPENWQPGVNFHDGATTFILEAPRKSHVFITTDYELWEPMDYMQMHVTPDGRYFHLTFNVEELPFNYYQYIIDGSLTIADPYSELILDGFNDPFIEDATYPGLSYPGGAKGLVSVIPERDASFDWQYDEVDMPESQDLIIYELLIRDFDDRHSYQSVMDRLDYLETLGVNAIELMPVMEFEGNSSWGYNTSFHFALDKYYGTQSDFKQFVDECHRRGIAVILDIVINHAYGQNPLVRMYWNDEQDRPAADSPWFNEVSPNQVFSFGYDFNHESASTRAYFKRVLDFWIEEYHIDGYRLDFTKGLTNNPGDGGSFDQDRISILKEYYYDVTLKHPGKYIILEHFAPRAEENALAQHGMLLWSNHNYNFAEIAMGYDANSAVRNLYMLNAENDRQPFVTYMESHDEERQAYKTKTWGNSSGDYNTKELVTAMERAKMTALMHLFAPGPKLIWMFGELGYDISIDEPCRVCEKPILWQYYEQKARRDLYEHYAEVIDLVQRPEIKNYDQQSTADSGELLIHKRSNESLNLVLIANKGVESLSNVNIDMEAGTYYEYFTGETLEVSSSPVTLTLAPGAFKLYSTTKLSSTSVVFPDSDIRVYPNPVEDIIHLEHKAVKRIVKYSIYGSDGSVIEEGDVLISEGIDLSHLKSGVYFFKLYTEDGNILVKKIIKS